jgi:MFS family permease
MVGRGHHEPRSLPLVGSVEKKEHAVGIFLKIGSMLPSDAVDASGNTGSLVEPHERIFTRTFVLLLTIQAAFGFCFSAFFILPKYLTVQLGLNASRIGLVTAASGILPLLTIPFLGSWIDHYGRKPFVVAGAGLSALSSLVFIWVDGYSPLLFSLRIVQGIAFMFAFNAAATIVADITPHERLGQALGFFGVSSLVTNGLTPYFLEPIADIYGWRPVFFFSAAAGALSLALACRLRESSTLSNHRASRDTDDSTLSLRFMSAPLFCSCAIGAAFGAMFAFYQPFALELGISRVRGFFVGFSLAAIATRLGLSQLADWIGARYYGD